MNVILVIGLFIKNEKTEYLLVSVRYAGKAKVRSEREREILNLSVFELRYVQQLLQFGKYES